MTDATDKTPHPTMLYRPGETVNPGAWGLKLDTLIVDANDAEAVAAAKADGWLNAADATAEKPAKAPK